MCDYFEHGNGYDDDDCEILSFSPDFKILQIKLGFLFAYQLDRSVLDGGGEIARSVAAAVES